MPGSPGRARGLLRTAEGRMERLFPGVEGGRRLCLVVREESGRRLRHGMRGKVLFLSGQRKRTAPPPRRSRVSAEGTRSMRWDVGVFTRGKKREGRLPLRGSGASVAATAKSTWTGSSPGRQGAGKPRHPRSSVWAAVTARMRGMYSTWGASWREFLRPRSGCRAEDSVPVKFLSFYLWCADRFNALSDKGLPAAMKGISAVRNRSGGVFSPNMVRTGK